MSPPPEPQAPRPAQTTLPWLLLIWLWALCLPGTLATAEEVLTSSASLRSVAYWDHRTQRALRLEGVITQVDPSRGLLVLQDDTGAVGIHHPNTFQGLKAGQRVLVSAVDCRPLFESEPAYPYQAGHRQRLADFETPANWSDQYIGRCRTLLVAPQTGEYRFWISSDDSSELWFGTQPATAERIARVDAWTRPRDWEQSQFQSSRPLRLEGGKTYYLESVHEQRGGSSHLSVAWEGPSIKRQVIPGKHLRALTGLETGAADKGPVLWEAWKGGAVDGSWRLSLCPRYNGVLSVPRLELTVLGTGAPPRARELEPRQTLGPEQQLAWSVVEGEVDFLSLNGQVLTLELLRDNKRIKTIVQDWTEQDTRQLRGRSIRVTGVPETVGNSQGKQEFARLWSPGPGQVKILPHRANTEAAVTSSILEILSREENNRTGLPLRITGFVLAQTGPKELLLQDHGSFNALVSEDGVLWEQIGPAIEVPMEREIHAGLAMNSASNASQALVRFEADPTFLSKAELTSIGYPSNNGRLAVAGPRGTLEGSGLVIWNSEDQFQFAHVPLKEEGELVARLVEQKGADPEAKAGIMLRGSLEAGAPFIGLLHTPARGLSLEWRRRAEGAIPKYIHAHAHRAPCWLKLVRRYSTLRVQSGDAPGVSPGQLIEVVGQVQRGQGETRLVEATCRPLSQGNDTLQPPPALRPLVPIASLSTEQGRAAAPDQLKVQGVVTFSGELGGHSYLAVQDESGGSLFSLRQGWDAALPDAGKQVEIHCDPGRTAQDPDMLVAETILLLGEGTEPRPLRHPLQYLLPRKGEGCWIETEGIVRSVTEAGLLQVRDAGELMYVHIKDVPRETLNGLIDSLVRLRGVVCFKSEQEKLLLVPSAQQLCLLEPSPPSPFDIPLQSLGSLGFPKVQNQSLHRIRTLGVVTFSKGKLAYIQDGAATLRLETSGLQAVPAGTTLEVSGFPDMTELGGLVLSEAVTRPGTPLSPPLPARLHKPLSEGREGLLVRITGQLAGGPPAEANGRLFLQTGGEAIEILSANGGPEVPPAPEGSLIEATGILVSNERGRPWLEGPAKTSLRLLLPSEKDLVVLQKPRWWVVQRTLLVTGGLALAGLLASWWIQRLRRRVAQRTAELEQTMSRLRQETQTAATLSERNRLAGEIHDSLEQGFSGLLLQLDTTAKLADCPPDVKAGLSLARNMVAFSRAEVQHAVWDLQSPLLENSSLQSALEQLTTQLGLEATKLRISCSGQPRRLAPADEHHLLRIAQEAVTNAVKHAEAKLILIEAAYEGQAFTLSISDDGRGFDPTRVLAGDLGHFGLRSLRGRARKINGDLTIHSEPGKGTRITVCLPSQPF